MKKDMRERTAVAGALAGMDEVALQMLPMLAIPANEDLELGREICISPHLRVRANSSTARIPTPAVRAAEVPGREGQRQALLRHLPDSKSIFKARCRRMAYWGSQDLECGMCGMQPSILFSHNVARKHASQAVVLQARRMPGLDARLHRFDPACLRELSRQLQMTVMSKHCFGAGWLQRSIRESFCMTPPLQGPQCIHRVLQQLC